MTVKEYAALHGKTEAAVYNRLKRKGLKISDLTADGQLTDAGLELLNSWYNSNKEPSKSGIQHNTKQSTIQDDSIVDLLKAQLEAMTEQNRALNERLSEAHKLIAVGQRLQLDAERKAQALEQQVEELTARLSAPSEPVMVTDDPPAADQPQEQPTVATEPPAEAEDQARTVTTTPDEGADQEQPTAQEETTDQATAADDSEVNEQQVVTPTRRSFRQWLADKILGKP